MAGRRFRPAAKILPIDEAWQGSAGRRRRAVAGASPGHDGDGVCGGPGRWSGGRYVSTESLPSANASLFRRLAQTPFRDLLRGRQTARLDIRHLVAEAALPAPLPELVWTIVRASRLWRRERVEL